MAAIANWKQPLIGILLFVIFFLLVAMLIGVWPIYEASSKDAIKATWFLNHALGTNLDVRLFVVVALSGAIGSSIQAAKSFAMHMGEGDFKAGYVAWYFLRFPIGIGLALLTYLVIRGGFLAGSFSESAVVAKSINPFGIAAVAALTGMFAREASDKLSEIFLNIFRTEKDNTHKPAAPVVSSATKTASGAGEDAKATFDVVGSGFVSGAMLVIGAKEFATEFVSATNLKASMAQKELGADKKAKVRNPTGPASNEVEITTG
jgi:hypothetical protein